MTKLRNRISRRINNRGAADLGENGEQVARNIVGIYGVTSGALRVQTTGRVARRDRTQS